MFENYPQYWQQIKEASKRMPQSRKSTAKKIVSGSCISAVAATVAIFFGLSAADSHRMDEALKSVSAEIASAPVEIKVVNHGNSMDSLLNDDVDVLTDGEKSVLSEQVRNNVSTEDLSNANGRFVNDTTAEIDVVTSDNIPVKITVVQANSQPDSYKIESVVAEIDRDVAVEQKGRLVDPNSTDEQKGMYAESLRKFTTVDLDKIISLTSGASDTEILGVYARQMEVLYPGVIMAIPAGYEVQDVVSADSSSSDANSNTASTSTSGANANANTNSKSNVSTSANSNSNTDASNANSNTSSDSNSSSNSNTQSPSSAAADEMTSALNTAISAGENSNANGMDVNSNTSNTNSASAISSVATPSAASANTASWKSQEGYSLTMRSEPLGDAFAQVNGFDITTKMMGYWRQTASSVAEESDQQLKDPDTGFQTRVFYDHRSGLWGYWGSVSFTDGLRTVSYDRVVFIDEINDYMITVSARYDGAVPYGIDKFKEFFFSDEGDWTGHHGDLAKITYDDKISSLQALKNDGDKSSSASSTTSSRTDSNTSSNTTSNTNSNTISSTASNTFPSGSESSNSQ